MSATKSASTGMPYLKPKLITVTLSRVVSGGAERLGDPVGELVDVEVGGVDDQVGVAAQVAEHLAARAGRPSSSRPLPCSGCGRRAASCRRTSTSSVASRKSSVVVPAGGALGEVGLQRLEERAGADVDHDRDRLLDAAALVDQPDHVAQQARRQVVDDVEAEVLELLGGGAAPGAGHAGDDDQLAVAGLGVPSSVLLDLAGGGVDG